MEISGAMKSGKISERRMKSMANVNNVAKLRERLETIKKQLPWIESLDITVDLKVPTEEMKEIISNNYKQEMLFYKQSQAGSMQSIARLKSMGVPTQRPEDYFAEMVKADEHMRRVKEKLVSKQLTLERTEKVSKMRKMKRLGKKVQQEVLKKRSEEKKKLLDNVKKMRKGKMDQSEKDDFEINIDKAPAKQVGKPGENRKRMAKDSKYGSGGKKRLDKKNTKESYEDTSDFSSKIHSKPKRGGRADKKKGGKPASANRPGKNRRANMKKK